MPEIANAERIARKIRRAALEEAIAVIQNAAWLIRSPPIISTLRGIVVAIRALKDTPPNEHDTQANSVIKKKTELDPAALAALKEILNG